MLANCKSQFKPKWETKDFSLCALWISYSALAREVHHARLHLKTDAMKSIHNEDISFRLINHLPFRFRFKPVFSGYTEYHPVSKASSTPVTKLSRLANWDLSLVGYSAWYYQLDSNQNQQDPHSGKSAVKAKKAWSVFWGLIIISTSLFMNLLCKELALN